MTAPSDLKELKKDMRAARRHVERGAAHLADAASYLRFAGFEQEARMMDSASYEAVNALARAESRANV